MVALSSDNEIISSSHRLCLFFFFRFFRFFRFFPFFFEGEPFTSHEHEPLEEDVSSRSQSSRRPTTHTVVDPGGRVDKVRNRWRAPLRDHKEISSAGAAGGPCRSDQSREKLIAGRPTCPRRSSTQTSPLGRVQADHWWRASLFRDEARFIKSASLSSLSGARCYYQPSRMTACRLERLAPDAGYG